MKRYKLWGVTFGLSCFLILLLFAFLKQYFTADISLIKVWHPKFFLIIFYSIRFILLGPFLVIIPLLYTSYPILKNKKKEIALLSFTFIICLIIAEISLRFIGYRPGYTGLYPFFNAVDSLYELQDYRWDDKGIVHFSDSNQIKINNFVEQAQSMNDSLLQAKFIDENDDFDYCSWLLVHDFGRLYTKHNNSPFSLYIKELCKRNELDDVDSAVLNYSRHPINMEGFKSIEFKTYKSKKKKILLIGDSFTYGMSARPVFISYADLLLTKGIAVWNPSFPNNDPESYLQIAKKYIPILKPDIVIVCFYMGNDIMLYNRETKFGKQHFFPTNAGWIKGEENGEYFNNAHDAYSFYLNQATIGTKTMTQYFGSKTILSTLVYIYLSNIFNFDSDKNKKITLLNHLDPIKLSYKKLKKIHEFSLSQNTPLIFTTLPDVIYQNSYNKHFKIDSIFKDLPNSYINKLTSEDYVISKTDGHFNNSGHSKTSILIDSIITSSLTQN